MDDRDLLKRLGNGETIESLCEDRGWDRAAFDHWWKGLAAARVPATDITRHVDVTAPVRIVRDERGIPHVLADNDADLFLGFGMAMAQDRLFQLDYLRRKGLGRLAEILGPEAIDGDLVARTMGLNRIAAAHWKQLPAEPRALLESFTAGVNAHLEELDDDGWPVEFDLLDYRPESFTPVDWMAIETEFRWYLTGRFPIIVMPELARRRLGEGPLYDEFICGEAEEEAIFPAGIWNPPPGGGSDPTDPVGDVVGDPDQAIGSNNWVASGGRTVSGQPLLASDPHIAFEAVSCWYQVHLCGGSFDVAGMSYVGIPAVMFGRTPRVAWGITNNICSQRDLYQERTDEAHPGCFEYDGQWEPAQELVERIEVRGGQPIEQTVRFSRNGPIVDAILPPPADRTGPVSMKWLGAYGGGWIEAMLGMDRAESVEEFREAMRPWHVPTFVLAIADSDGHIAMQSSGRVPYRDALSRGYRRGWDPGDRWSGLIPYDALPHVVDPQRGWMASANHRSTDDSYPYRLFGCWSSGHRGKRIREMFEAHPPGIDRDEFARMQLDAKSGRAVECVPPLLAVLDGCDEPLIARAAEILSAWNGECLPEEVGPSLFNVFYRAWSRRVVEVRFEADEVELLAKGVEAAAGRLLSADPHGWFADDQQRRSAIVAAMRDAVELLSERFGDGIENWTWGRLHLMPLRHVLSGRGELAELLDHGGAGVRGDMLSVGNTGLGPDWEAATGAGYRHVVDLADDPPGLWTIDGQGQSGHPGSRHYRDQYNDWIEGNLRFVPLGSGVQGETIQQLLPGSPANEDE
ncbi:MAG: hypothetical protein CMJ45_13885 [Planctomyces sp.]|nr:hypothetical protein [Planctomyces sp.]